MLGQKIVEKKKKEKEETRFIEFALTTKATQLFYTNNLIRLDTKIKGGREGWGKITVSFISWHRNGELLGSGIVAKKNTIAKAITSWRNLI